MLVIARLCEPSSELHIAEDWFRRTALEDLLGLPEAKVNVELTSGLKLMVGLTAGSMAVLKVTLKLKPLLPTWASLIVLTLGATALTLGLTVSTANTLVCLKSNGSIKAHPGPRGRAPHFGSARSFWHHPR